MRVPELGTCALARSWTDWEAPSVSASQGEPAAYLDFESLLQLVELVHCLKGRQGVDR